MYSELHTYVIGKLSFCYVWLIVCLPFPIPPSHPHLDVFNVHESIILYFMMSTSLMSRETVPLSRSGMLLGQNYPNKKKIASLRKK